MEPIFLPIELIQMILKLRTQLLYKECLKKREVIGWKMVHKELLSEHDIYYDNKTIYIPPRLHYPNKNKWCRITTNETYKSDRNRSRGFEIKKIPRLWWNTFVGEHYVITDYKGHMIKVGEL